MKNLLRLPVKKLKADSTCFCEIPEDLIIQILLRLPVNSILKFRCVSKAWRSFISSKQFVESQLNITATNKTNYVRIIASGYQSQYYLPFKEYNLNGLLNIFEDDDHKAAAEFYFPMRDYEESYFEFIGSYNGLCCAFIGRLDEYSYKRRLFLWNPSTRKSRELELPTIPRTYVHNIGFGFDGVDYKILSIYRDCGSSDIKVVRLYSSGTNAWKTIDDDVHKSMLPYVKSIRGRIGRFVNGKLYWMREIEHKLDLFYFDLGSEAYGTVEVPQVQVCDCIRVFEADACLFIIFYRADNFEVWVLKQHGSNDEPWNKLITATYRYHRSTIPVWITGDGEYLIKELFNPQAIMFYDPESDSFKQSNISLPRETFISLVAYVTSLVSPFPDNYDLKQDDN